MFALATRKQSHILTGIDLDADGIAIAQVRRGNEGHCTLAGCEFKPATIDADSGLAPLLQGHALARRHCTAVLPTADYQLLVVESPEVPPAELRAAIRWRIHDIIDFHVDDAVLDVFDAPGHGPVDIQKQLYVVVARSATIRQRIGQLEQAGVNLEVIDIPELAMRNIAARLPEDAGGVAMVYFRPEQCLITLTRDSTLYLARNLDFGYRQLHESSAKPQNLTNRLALEIQRSMDYYERQFRQAPVKSLVIMPVPDMPYCLTDALQQILGLDTRAITIRDVIECESEPDHETGVRCLLAIGAALRSEPYTL